MTKDEKVEIYRLLKTASDGIYGFSSPDFPGEIPVFEDDGPQADISFSQPDPTLETIASKIASCSRCPLSNTRHNVVPGEGPSNPFVMVIGEGPGEEEDKSGRPFVGPAGQLLDKMLSAIQLSRNSNTFIANIVKCRPPMNRNPESNEAEACRSFLDAQIAALKPKAILAAGSVAIKNLLKSQDGVMKLHGKILEYRGIPLMTTFHPSALLRAPENKRIAWEDLKAFKRKLLEINPSYDQGFKG